MTIIIVFKEEKEPFEIETMRVIKPNFDEF
jgi:hypothetical protein